MATRGSGISKAEWDKVCKAANKAISLLQRGSRTSDVAATFTSHATGRKGQHVFEIFAMDADDKCRNETVENEASSEDDESTDEDPTESKTKTITTLIIWKPPHVETLSVLKVHLEDDYRRRCEQCLRFGHSWLNASFAATSTSACCDGQCESE